MGLMPMRVAAILVSQVFTTFAWIGAMAGRIGMSTTANTASRSRDQTSTWDRAVIAPFVAPDSGGIKSRALGKLAATRTR